MMKLYKSPKNEIWAYEEDGSQDHLIPSNFVALTLDEINSFETKIQNEQAQAQAIRSSAIAKLNTLGLTQDEIKALVG
jgi:hypothetical protein